jgi:hypothetical protein
MMITRRDQSSGEITVTAKDFTAHVTEASVRILIDDAVVHESGNQTRSLRRGAR